jgi:GAF domain-containing protein
MSALPLLAEKIPASSTPDSLSLLGNSPAEFIDWIARWAAKALSVPIVLISLREERRHWFKTCVSLDVIQSLRDSPLCEQVIRGRGPLILCDISVDPRFSGNSDALETSRIRACLGLPLHTVDGKPIGALCALDTQPRQFAFDDLTNLSEFARIAEQAAHARELAAQAKSALAG